MRATSAYPAYAVVRAVKDVLLSRNNIPAHVIENMMQNLGWAEEAWFEYLSLTVDQIEAGMLREWQEREQVES